MGPNLGDIEDVPLVLGGISNRHNLDLEAPSGRLATGNVVEQVSGGVVGISGLDGIGLVSGQVLDAGVGLEVEFDKELVTLVIDPLESVRAVAVHVSVAIRGTSVREEDGDLMSRFGGKRQEVPEHVGILQVGLGVSLLGVDEIGELLGVSDEEDGGVVAGHIPVAFLSVELDGETSGISLSIGRTLLTTDGGESGEDGGSLSNLIQEFGLGVLGDVMSDLEVTVSTSTLSVHNSLRDSLSVEVSKLVDEVEVLEEDGTILASSHGVLVVIDGRTSGGGKISILVDHFFGGE
mmetsp:Transcript_137763/g.194883  ORF Transcript_137763/g.194883 Transcript_137763/m.194883 type:complete len:292 (-) Transcript_137763:39-914(-)